MAKERTNEKSVARNRQTSVVPSQNPRGNRNGARSKFNAVKTEVDGIVFDSGAEAERYGELRLMEKAGKIEALTVQPEYELSAKSGGVVGIYRADFLYLVGEELVVEDVKGMATLPLAKWKQKHLFLQYGIKVREIRRK